jgi:hypothetical protein
LNEFISAPAVDGVQLDLFPAYIPERRQAILHGSPVMVIDEKGTEALFLRQEHKLIQVIGPVTEGRPQIHQACYLLVFRRKRNADIGCKKDN